MIVIASSLLITGVAVVIIVGLIAWSTTPPTRAPDLPGPRGWPIVGNLFQRGADPAHTYHMWSKIYGPVFKLRLANRWVVVVNGAEAGDELLNSAQYAAVFQSRPSTYTLSKFLGLASPKAVTLGFMAYDDLVKNKRRLSITSVNPAVTKTYQTLIEKAAQYFVQSLNDANKKENGGPMDPFPVFFGAATTLAVTVLCGAPPKEISNILEDIPFPMKHIGEMRKIHGHLRDFLPFLRFLPDSKLFKEAVIVAKYRNKKIDWMLDRARLHIAEGNDPPCIAGTILGENHGLAESSITSVASSMVASGLDAHMANMFLWGLGILASKEGIQEKAYEAILLQDKLGSETNWARKDDYVIAFVKELGRYYNPFRLSLAHETMGKDIVWKGHVIPVGTTVYTNTHAMNRDEARFPDPEKFWPERYMNGPEADRALYNYAFGIGRRSCPAVNLVNTELYTIFKHIIRHWSISIYDGEKEFNAVDGCANGHEFNQGPKQFRIKMAVRDQQKLDAYLNLEL